MRHNLDESPHPGEILVPLPAELRELILAWQHLVLAAGPGRSGEFGLRHGSGDATPDSSRAALRLFADAKRKEIGRLAVKIDRRVREVTNCKTCKAENDWAALSCESCGAPLRGGPIRTSSAGS